MTQYCARPRVTGWFISPCATRPILTRFPLNVDKVTVCYAIPILRYHLGELQVPPQLRSRGPRKMSGRYSELRKKTIETI